jgi:hypothetical protein
MSVAPANLNGRPLSGRTCFIPNDRLLGDTRRRASTWMKGSYLNIMAITCQTGTGHDFQFAAGVNAIGPPLTVGTHPRRSGRGVGSCVSYQSIAIPSMLL